MTDGTNNDAPRAFAPIIHCRACASPLVQATDWELQDGSLWYVRLWCPECGFEQAAVLDRPQSSYLSLAIEEGFAQMLEAISQLNTGAGTGADSYLVHKAQTERIERTGR
ncbi:MAG: hypothetical protein GXY46_04035 [Actinobacteria bacterium]|nr:hypothetical protein [Actinomycetota bacterium]